MARHVRLQLTELLAQQKDATLRHSSIQLGFQVSQFRGVLSSNCWHISAGASSSGCSLRSSASAVHSQLRRCHMHAVWF